MTQISKAAAKRMVHLLLVFSMVLSLAGGFLYSAQAKSIYNIKADTNVTTTVEGFAADIDSSAVETLLEQAGVELSASDVVEVTVEGEEPQQEAPESESLASSVADASVSGAVQMADASVSAPEQSDAGASISAQAEDASASAQSEDASAEQSAVEQAQQSDAGQNTDASAEQSTDTEKNADASAEQSARQSSSEQSTASEQSADASAEQSQAAVDPADGAVSTDPADGSAAASASASAQSGDKVITVTVTRPKYVTVTVDQTLTSVQLQEGDTVRDVIDRLNIVLGENDLVSQELDAQPNPEQPITINRVELSYFKKTKTRDYDVVYKADPHSYIGEEYVKREGVPYKKVDTYEKKIIDGGEPIITKVKTKITKSKDEIICYGTKVDSPSPSGLSASSLVITNRDEHNGTITLSDGSTYSYSSVSDSFEATAYCGGGICSTGRAAQVGVVAVDPSVIPYGTRMYITSGSIVYGVCVAGDTGVSGHLIDLYFNTESHCRSFGRRGITVYFLD